MKGKTVYLLFLAHHSFSCVVNASVLFGNNGTGGLRIRRHGGGYGTDNDRELTLDLPPSINYSFHLLTRIFGKENSQFSHYIKPAGRITVNISWSLERLVGLDEGHQVVSVSLNERWYWIHDELKWDPREFGDIEKVRVPIEYIWEPGLVLWNSVDDKYVKLLPEGMALLGYNGHVTWIRPEVYRVGCHLNIIRFPFDRHTCNFTIGSWSYEDKEVHVQPREINAADATRYHKNSQWRLISFKSYSKVAHYHEGADGHRAPFSLVVFSMEIQRVWLFPFLFLVFPNVLMTIICVCSYVLPCESNEKGGINAAIFLATLTYLLLFYDTLPLTDSVPYIAMYLLFVIFQTTLSITVCAIDIYVHHSGKLNSEGRLPKWARLLCLERLGTFFGLRDAMAAKTDISSPFAIWPYDTDENELVFDSADDEAEPTSESENLQPTLPPTQPLENFSNASEDNQSPDRKEERNISDIKPILRRMSVGSSFDEMKEKNTADIKPILRRYSISSSPEDTKDEQNDTDVKPILRKVSRTSSLENMSRSTNEDIPLPSQKKEGGALTTEKNLIRRRLSTVSKNDIPLSEEGVPEIPDKPEETENKDLSASKQNVSKATKEESIGALKIDSSKHKHRESVTATTSKKNQKDSKALISAPKDTASKNFARKNSLNKGTEKKGKKSPNATNNANFTSNASGQLASEEMETFYNSYSHEPRASIASNTLMPPSTPRRRMSSIRSVYVTQESFFEQTAIPPEILVRLQSIREKDLKKNLQILYQKIFKIMETYGAKLVRKDQHDAIITEWKQASMILDRIFLIANLVASALFAVFFITNLYDPTPDDYIL